MMLMNLMTHICGVVFCVPWKMKMSLVIYQIIVFWFSESDNGSIFIWVIQMPLNSKYLLPLEVKIYYF